MENIVQVYKAMSEEMRLRLLMLLTHGELCVCDLMAIFGEPQSKVSRHLAYLKHSGLVKSKRVGVWMHYSLQAPLDEVSGAQLGFIKEKRRPLPRNRPKPHAALSTLKRTERPAQRGYFPETGPSLMLLCRL